MGEQRWQPLPADRTAAFWSVAARGSLGGPITLRLGAEDVIMTVGGALRVFKNTLKDEDLLASVTDGLHAYEPGEPGFVPNVQIRYGRLIDPKTRQIIKQDPHPVHAYAAAGERAPGILRAGGGNALRTRTPRLVPPPALAVPDRPHGRCRSPRPPGGTPGWHPSRPRSRSRRAWRRRPPEAGLVAN